MSGDIHPDPEAPLFAARLVPHRSLGLAQFRLLMGVLALVSAITGSVFLTLGAWPVFGFLGLDVVFIYFAFRRNFRDARAFETVAVSPLSIDVIHVDARGRRRSVSLNPAWTRFDVERDHEGDILRLSLVSHGRRHPVAGFLPPADRERFAAAFSRALHEARRGPRRDFLPPITDLCENRVV